MLERVIWDAITDIAVYEGVSLYQFCQLVDQRRLTTSLTAALRVVVVIYLRHLTQQQTTQYQKHHLGAPQEAPAPVKQLPTDLQAFQDAEARG